MKRSIPLVAALVAAACVLSACGGGGASSSGSKKVVHVAHVPSPLFAPLYVARDKGYFADEGINVQLNTVSSGQSAVPLLSSGQADVLVAGFSAGFFNAINAGLKLKVVGGMAVRKKEQQSAPSAALMVSSDLMSSGVVKTPADLAGRTVAVAGGLGGSGAYLTDVILRQYGLTLKDIKVSKISNANMPAAVKNGAVDAALTSVPYTKVMEDASTAKPLATLPDGTSSTGVIYSEKFARSDQAKGFFRAITRASGDLQGEARRKAANIDPVADVMKVNPAAIKKLPPFYWQPDLRPLPDQIMAMQRTWIAVGAIKYSKPIPASKLVDNSFSKSAGKG